MSPGWEGGTPPAPRALPQGAWMRLAWRLPAMAVLIFGCLLVLLLLRLIERPLFGVDRPLTPWITVFVCKTVLRIIGLPIQIEGQRMTDRGALVANHTSWLDIFVLNSLCPLYFVSKSEVARWPGIGWLARATGTLFIRRDRREAATQSALLQARLMHNHRLLFFPEGTSTDGLRVLPFKTTLFAAFFDEALLHEMRIQAISLVYLPPSGQEPGFYGWWGDMDFGPSLLEVAAQKNQGRVRLSWHTPVRVDGFANRKSLARHLEAQVRKGHDALRIAPSTGM